MSNLKPEEPILDSELTWELKGKFQQLFEETYHFSDMHHDIEYMHTAATTLHRHLHEQVSAHPILAQTVCEHTHKWSLLEVLCAKAYHPFCRESVKFLIDQNPCALLWRKWLSDDFSSCALIHQIAESPWHCDLLPWIAERHLWVFEHKLCQTNPPHSRMVKSYVYGYCGPEVIRKFYELYPRGLQEECKELPRGTYGKFPLSISLGGMLEGLTRMPGGLTRLPEPDADTFIWMAKQYPEAVYYSTWAGNLLHQVFRSMTIAESGINYTSCTPNKAKICRFLIIQHVDLVREKALCNGYLPIHVLTNHCNLPIVQEIVILLLKAYPECVLEKSDRIGQDLCRVPFIQRTLPLLREESVIDREISMLVDVSQKIFEATASLTNHSSTTLTTPNESVSRSFLLDSVSEIFRSWTNLRISSTLSASKQRIQECVAETCRELEADDVYLGRRRRRRLDWKVG